MNMKRIMYHILLLLLTLSIGFIMCESCLRFYYYQKSKNKYCVHAPDQRRIFKPDPGVLPGVEGLSRFNTNSMGIRGDEFSDSQQYRILALGGSTTECLYLDETEAWPYLLQQKLNSLHMSNVWVGSIAASGKNTRDHILHMKYMIPQYPNIDMIIILPGVNDLIQRLGKGTDYNAAFMFGPDYDQEQMIKGFSVSPFRKKKLALWRLARKIKHLYLSRAFIQDEVANFYIVKRERRKQGLNILTNAPDLTKALEEYDSNINVIIDISKQYSIRPIFLTQPFLWRADLSKSDKDLCWLGWVDKSYAEYYSLEVLASCLELYNNRLIDVCKSRGVEYVDLEAYLPKDTTVFYDDVHFNENGASMVADIIFKKLRKKEPFVQQTEK